MPTIFREKGYRFFFYEADLIEPIHVHVVKSGKTAKFWLMPLSVAVKGDLEIMSLTTLRTLSKSDTTKSSPLGTRKKIKGTITKVQITIDKEFRPFVPVFIPDLNEVRALAERLHRQNEYWKGEAFGWEVEYNPSRPESPPNSRMPFTPADFWIGDATIWGFSLMWEDGDDKAPVESVSDWNVVEELQQT
ncbi:MAG: DUF4160 domain-containing protein [Caldilinea sp. CFX5]|nr:DUF4160 domain-containing protein [Caldilinea sp. CFX5]